MGMHHQSEWGPRSEREPRDEVHILGKNSEPFWPFLDGLGIGEVMKGAASLRSLKESYTDSFEYDIQQRPWYVSPLLRLGATLGSPKSEAQSEPPLYRAFPLTVYGFCFLIIGFLLQFMVALIGAISVPK
jgi:hypothetical protein